MQTIKIFRQIEELMIGTYRYERRVSDTDTGNQSVFKKFVPIFPHLYLRQRRKGVNKPENFNINPRQIQCHFYHKNMEKTSKLDDDQLFEGKRLPSSIQLAFQVSNRDLLPGSKDFSRYCVDEHLKKQNRYLQCDINLNQFRSNINHSPKIFYHTDKTFDDQGNLIDDSQMTLMIELNVPVPFFENERGFIKILSPLQLENDLLNYWNLKQVIFIKGRRHESMKNFKGYC